MTDADINPPGIVDVAVVCATCNVASTIADFVKHINAVMTEAGRTWHLLAVDDSDDDTPSAIRLLAADGYPVSVLHRRPAERIGGYSGALVEGFAVTSGRAIAVVDVDTSAPAAVLGRLLDDVFSGADIAIASRFVAGAHSVATDGWLRQLASQCATKICRAMFREVRNVTDPSSGCFVFRQEVTAHVVFRPERFRVLIEILVRGTWRQCVDVPNEFVGPALGSRTVGPLNVSLYLSRLFRLWLETRVDPGRFAETDAARGNALSADVPWVDAVDSTPAPGVSVLMVASEVTPTSSGVARTVGRLGTELERCGIDVSYMSGQDYWRLGIGEVRFSALGVALLTSRELRQHDVLILHGPMPTVTELVLAAFAVIPRRHRIRLIYVHHFDVDFRYLGVPSIMFNLVHHALARSVDHLVVTSHSYGAVLSRGSGDNVTVIPWAVDQLEPAVASSDYDGERPLRVLFVGQQRGYKGISNLILAVAGQPELELTVAGSGPLLCQHIDLVAELGARNVTVLGQVEEQTLDELFASHDVIALPSISRLEAFGMVLLEGMRAGCVPVAADLAGVRDVVGQHGILVAPRRIASLRDALVRLAGQPDEVRERSAAAVERSAQFAWDRTGDRYTALVSEALSDGS
ncbi:MAG: glycosyltransferase involved in cell wall biosynthesis [Candidatus Azotimanducaceae bacterium]